MVVGGPGPMFPLPGPEDGLSPGRYVYVISATTPGGQRISFSVAYEISGNSFFNFK